MSFIGIGLGAFLRGTVSGWWAEYKTRHASEPRMVKRKGIWQPSQFILRVERTTDYISYVGLALVAIAIASAGYSGFRL